VKTVSDKVVRHSLAYLERPMTVDVRYLCGSWSCN